MLEHPRKVLTIDDEIQIRRMLKLALSSHSYQVLEACNGQEGLTKVITERPEFVLLDLGLPDISGLQVLKELRQWYNGIIIVLSAKSSESTVVEALDLGADDYLVKPFGLPELLARMRVASRRSIQSLDPTLTVGPLKLDLGSHLVFKNETELELTSLEFQLLSTMMKHAGKILTHQQLLKTIWGPNSQENVHYLRVYIGHLRQKIEDDPRAPKLIQTEPGIGYRLVSSVVPK
jgi:two-component system, OmpR family, KDP operon response regulator KdpE